MPARSSEPTVALRASVRRHRSRLSQSCFVRSITPKHAASLVLAPTPTIGPSVAAGIASARSHSGRPGRRSDRHHRAELRPVSALGPRNEDRERDMPVAVRPNLPERLWGPARTDCCRRPVAVSRLGRRESKGVAARNPSIELTDQWKAESLGEPARPHSGPAGS
jgi:hypothetical protein